MPALPRKTQSVFGAGLSAPGNIAQWGSVVAGTPVYSNDLSVLQSLGAWLNGFNGGVVGNRSPSLEEMNAAFLIFSQQIAYVLQSGIPQWDAGTIYWTDNMVRVGSILYVSTADNNTSDPAVANWSPYLAQAKGPTVAAAWVNFNGNNGAILASHNVSGVVRTAAGRYTITFATAMANANYAVVGSCGAADGGLNSSPAGNNNALCRDTITTTTQVSVWLPKPDQTYGEDADIVSVLIFA